jgi:hypothetical protein
MRVATSFLALVLLAACAAPPKPQQVLGQKFSEIERPPIGKARLYIFRPGFNGQLADEPPLILVNDHQVTRLWRDGFTSVVIAPTTLRVAVRPAAGESDRWNANAEFVAEANKTYFAAAWMDEAGSSVEGMAFLPLRGAVLPVLTRRGGTVLKASATRLELVTEDQAVPVLKDLQQIPTAEEQSTR